MNAGNLIFLLLIVGAPLAMFSMHRGGHAHGGTVSGGGCCGGGGHNHGASHEEEQTPNTTAGQETQPLLGPPGTQSGTPVPAPAQKHRHRGC